MHELISLEKTIEVPLLEQRSKRAVNDNLQQELYEVYADVEQIETNLYKAISIARFIYGEYELISDKLKTAL